MPFSSILAVRFKLANSDSLETFDYKSLRILQQENRKLRNSLWEKTFHIHAFVAKTMGWKTHLTLKIYRLTEDSILRVYSTVASIQRTLRIVIINCRHKKYTKNKGFDRKKMYVHAYID